MNGMEWDFETLVVGAVQAKIDAAAHSGGTAAAAHVVSEGQRIYARKPNMGEHDVTWSQAEYGHLGKGGALCFFSPSPNPSIFTSLSLDHCTHTAQVS